jgi:hypothetical protein
VCYGSGSWRNGTTPTQAITSIVIQPLGGSGFIANSEATLYGMP